jgi:hypothetical protein
MSSFFLTLPANGSQRYFSENRIGNYKIKLPYKVHLQDGNFEVALTELTYVCSIKSLTGINYDNLIEFGGRHQGGSIELPLVHYSNLNQLISAINEKFQKHEVKCSLFQWEVKNRISLEVSSGYNLTISTRLSDILGFDGVIEFNGPDLESSQPISFFGKFCPDILGGRYHMFVYCDIIEPQVVGSSLVPLLRMVNISGHEGEPVTQAF